jgi:hypothetical protein
MKEKKFDFHIFVMRLAAVLLSLVMLTTGMVSGRYARYVTSATGSDSARVAKFTVTQQSIKYGTTDLTTMIPMPELLPGESKIVDMLVEYDTEVTVKNVISVESLYHNLPLTFRISEQNTDSSFAERAEFICESGKYTKAYQLTITWPADKNSQDYIGMVDLLEITVTTEQVD